MKIKYLLSLRNIITYNFVCKYNSSKVNCRDKVIAETFVKKNYIIK